MKKIFELEQRHGSIIKGLIKTRNDKQKDDPIHYLFNDLNLKDYATLLNKYAIYYLKDGMEILTKTLVEYLRTVPNVELISNQTIQKIHFQENQIDIFTRTNDKYHLDHLISALPAFELSKLIDHEILRSRLNQIPFVNMIVINLLYQREDIFPKEAFGYLIPSREHSHLLGVLFDSCIRHATDKDKRGSQLTVMMGGVWYDEFRLGQCTDEQLMLIAMKELKKQMNLDEKPAVYSIARLNKAIPVSEKKFSNELK
jgi:oxygen-dependent protoporphyrinogen oxidase